MNRSRYLAIATPALLTYIAGQALFEVCSSDGAQFGTVVRGAVSAPAGANAILDEAAARYLWLATAALNLLIPAFAIFYSAVLIRCCRHRAGWHSSALAAAILCAAGLAAVALGARSGGALYHIVYHLAFSALASAGHYEAGLLRSVGAVIGAINILAVVGVNMVLVAFCATVTPPPAGADRLDHIAGQARRLKETLNLGGALLVVGILHMGAWMRWPAALVEEPATQHAIAQFGLAVTIFWGAIFTVMITAAYLPAVTRLRADAERALEGSRVENAPEWLARHGLDMSPGRQLPRVAVMLAPLLAGPVASAAGSLFTGL